MEITSLYENLIFTTVRIECLTKTNSSSIGTGCIVSYHREEGDYYFIVTNKHVIKDAVKGILQFNLSKNDQPDLGSKYSLIFNDFEKIWFGHNNPNIDIAIAPIVPFLNELKKENINIFFKAIPLIYALKQENIKEVDAIEDILIIGYPNGIYDKKNLLPIVRKGITATPANIDFEGKPIFLIDASIFPGSSGSPVFICNTGGTSKQGYDKQSKTRFIFMGIVASVFIKQDINKIEIINIPVKDIPFVKTSQMLDLGVVFKSHCIIETIESFLKTRQSITK